MSVTGFFHAGVTVSDMGAALRFYRDGLGLEVSSDGSASGAPAARIWALDLGQCGRVPARAGKRRGRRAVRVLRRRAPQRVGAAGRPRRRHFCLYVDDAEAMLARLTAAGFRSRSGEAATITRGPHAGAKAVYMLDPDGHHVELYQRAQDSS